MESSRSLNMHIINEHFEGIIFSRNTALVYDHGKKSNEPFEQLAGISPKPPQCSAMIQVKQLQDGPYQVKKMMLRHLSNPDIKRKGKYNECI